MHDLKIIDINLEFSLLYNLINKLWDGFDKKNAKKALIMAFEQGLEDAKLWVNQNVGIFIANALDGNDAINFPLENRRKFLYQDDSKAYIYDALCKFDQNLCIGLSEIQHSITGYGRWSYTQNADLICNKIKEEFSGLIISPKELDNETQKAIEKEFQGVHDEYSRTLTVPQLLSKKYVDGLEELGISIFYSLFSSVYSHGLLCAKTKNTQMLIEDLFPIYSKRNEPLNFDNGNDIMTVATINPFVSIINSIYPFEFSSTEEYFKQKKLSKKIERKTVNQTLEESVLHAVSDFEIETDERRVNKIIDEICPKFPAFKLS